MAPKAGQDPKGNAGGGIPLQKNIVVVEDEGWVLRGCSAPEILASNWKWILLSLEVQGVPRRSPWGAVGVPVQDPWPWGQPEGGFQACQPQKSPPFSLLCLSQSEQLLWLVFDVVAVHRGSWDWGEQPRLSRERGGGREQQLSPSAHLPARSGIVQAA